MYLSTGINPDGGEFDGFVHIERHADSFRVTWLMEQTEGDTILLVPTGVGTGIVHGGMLAVSFHDSGMDGIGLFHIEDEGRGGPLDARRRRRPDLSRSPGTTASGRTAADARRSA